MFVLVDVSQHEEQLAGGVFFVVGFVCAWVQTVFVAYPSAVMFLI